jgi:hypothetical protein
MVKLLNKNPSCAVRQNTGEKTREGDISGVGLLERMKRGRGIMGLDDKSSGMEILMTETFVKINPTDPLILAKQSVEENENDPFPPVFR